MEPRTEYAIQQDHRDGMYDVLGSIARMESVLAGVKARVIARITKHGRLVEDPKLAEQVIASEIACLLRIPEATARALMTNSICAVDELPATMDSLESGEVSWRHVEKMVDHVSALPDEAKSEFERAVLSAAETMTVAKFDNRARKVRERMHPDSITERRASAFERRSVRVDKGRNGMSWITAYLPAEQCEAIDNRLEDIARGLRCDDDPRTLPQHRADAFADLLINGDPANRKSDGITANVNVTIPWLTLLGRSEEPADLEGYGPIPADVARELCAEATSFTRILTDPVTGTVLTLDRAKRLPSKKLAAWLRLRDGTCRFPGCNRKARKADIDHTIDWQYGGPTNADNLACLCEHHHRLKHNTRWTVQQIGDGILEWVSPDGRRHETRPELQLTG